MLKTPMIATLLLTVVLSGAASAESVQLVKPGAESGASGEREPQRDPAKLFDKLDADASGAITLEEFASGREGMRRPTGDRPEPSPEKIEKRFSMIDADGNGEVTLEEMMNARPEPEGERGERGERGPKPDAAQADQL